MAENLPNLPTGAAPPRPAEAAKVQPKKETVRINLPPKPTSAPTIKLPTPPPAAIQTPAPAPAAAGAAIPASASVTAAAPVATSAPRAVASAPRAAAGPVRPPAPSASVSMLDTILAVAVALAGVVALVRVWLLTNS